MAAPTVTGLNEQDIQRYKYIWAADGDDPINVDTKPYRRKISIKSELVVLEKITTHYSNLLFVRNLLDLEVYYALYPTTSVNKADPEWVPLLNDAATPVNPFIGVIASGAMIAEIVLGR